MTRYCIKKGYSIRESNAAFDDTPFKDEFQLPVYRRARELADQLGCLKILDVGCGSGFKLVQWFPPPFSTLGLDLPPTVEFLRKTYPGKSWESSWPMWDPDLVVCADVIEHLEDPDVLVSYLASLKARVVVLSTPDRDLLGLGTEDGPPKNVHHVREWNSAELVEYLGASFHVARHFIVDGATQVCELERRTP